MTVSFPPWLLACSGFLFLPVPVLSDFPETCLFLLDFLVYWHIAAHKMFLKSFVFPWNWLWSLFFHSWLIFFLWFFYKTSLWGGVMWYTIRHRYLTIQFNKFWHIYPWSSLPLKQNRNWTWVLSLWKKNLWLPPLREERPNLCLFCSLLYRNWKGRRYELWLLKWIALQIWLI